MELELINNQLLAKTPIETIIQDTTITYTTTSQYGFSEVSPKYAIQRERLPDSENMGVGLRLKRLPLPLNED